MLTTISLFVAANGHLAECSNPLLPCKFVQYDHQYTRQEQQGCPATKPDLHGACGFNSLYCDYDNDSIRFQCHNGQWKVLWNRYCELNGQQVPNGFLYLKDDGCVAATCEAGRVQFNDCTRGCGYWGKYLTPGFTGIDKNFKNQNQENNHAKYVQYRCDYHNHISTFSGNGCRKDGVNYPDGFVLAQKDGTDFSSQSSKLGITAFPRLEGFVDTLETTPKGFKLLWACRDGVVRWLGGPGALKFPSGAATVGYKTADKTSKPYRKATPGQAPYRLGSQNDNEPTFGN